MEKEQISNQEQICNELIAYGYSVEEATRVSTLRDNLEKQEQKLTKRKAMALARKIRPLMRVTTKGKIRAVSMSGQPTGAKVWVGGAGIQSVSYTMLINRKTKVYAPAKGLRKIGEITTYHKCGYYALLKPSVYEVLYQIPENLRDKVVAFELYAVSNRLHDVYDDALNRHRLQCILYTGEMPEEIAKERVQW